MKYIKHLMISLQVIVIGMVYVKVYIVKKIMMTLHLEYLLN